MRISFHSVVACAFAACHLCASNGARAQEEKPAMMMTVTSSAFPAGGQIPARYTEDGKDVSPPLVFEGVPSGTRELALVCDDPDAPSRDPWVHWVIYNISPQTGELPEGVSTTEKPPAPDGALQGRNSWKKVGYRGPAPPRGHGTHHYHFKVYALDAEVARRPGLDKAELLAAAKGHVLAEGELVGTYERK
jgi:Raf kinase inhibitor-like YbhB/YbcL family protein